MRVTFRKCKKAFTDGFIGASRFTDPRASISGERDDVIDARRDRFGDVGHRSQASFGNRWGSPRFALTSPFLKNKKIVSVF